MIEYKNKWLCSYETICFDTKDGDIDKNEYAVTQGGYLIRTKPKDEAQFEFVEELDTTGMEEVHIVEGEHCYYDEFLTAKGAEAVWGEEKKEIPTGGVIRIQSTGKKYWDTARIKNHPQPEKVEMVEELPPPEPPEPLPEHHSIAHNSSTNSGKRNTVSSFSWSHECTGSDLTLIVGVSIRESTVADRPVSSVIYNADSLIKIDEQNNDTGSTLASLWYRAGPDTGGSYTVQVTMDGTCSDVVGGATSLTGTDADPIGASSKGSGKSKEASVVVTTEEDNSWVHDVAIWYESFMGNDAVGADQTERWNIDAGTRYGAGSTEPKVSAGNVTMSWDIGGVADRDWTMVAAEIKEKAAAGPAVPVLAHHHSMMAGGL